MTAGELARLLLNHPEFKVQVSITDENAKHWPSFESFDVTGLCDIGYSDRVIVLDTERTAL